MSFEDHVESQGWVSVVKASQSSSGQCVIECGREEALP
jgi:hypothetical protein